MALKLVTVGMMLGLVSCESVRTPGLPATCLTSTFARISPSMETGRSFAACTAWQNVAACCTSETTTIIRDGTGVYNYSTECGALSEECQRYLDNAACFYNCEPVLYYFGVGNSTLIYRVPICASYCNDWFTACRNDFTCVVNWLTRINIFIETGYNTCPRNHRCQTFEEAYGDGKGLCNTMWGSSYMYSEDGNNCTVMDFEGDIPNPNLQLSFPVKDTASKESISLITIATIAIGLLHYIL